MEMKDFMSNREPAWMKPVETSLNQFPIFLSRNWTTGTNFHNQPGLEIHITHAGNGTMVVGKQVILQSPRSVLVYRGKVPHQMLSKSTYKRSVICINFSEEDNNMLPSLHRLIDFAWIPEDSCLSFSLNPKQFQEMESMCNTLQHELEANMIGWERMALAQMLMITAFLQRSSVDQEQVTTLSPKMANKKDDLVQLCADYVCHNLDKDLSLRAIARHFAVSGEHLTRCFTKEMGISFYQYVLLQRVAEGKRLLIDAVDVSITDIAYMVGFPSPSHFSRLFKTLTEQSPSIYRQKLLAMQR